MTGPRFGSNTDTLDGRGRTAGQFGPRGDRRARRSTTTRWPCTVCPTTSGFGTASNARSTTLTAAWNSWADPVYTRMGEVPDRGGPLAAKQVADHFYLSAWFSDGDLSPDLYDGHAVLTFGDRDIAVRARLGGHVAAIDRRYRGAEPSPGDLPDDALKGQRAVTVSVEGHAAPARLAERTPWWLYRHRFGHTAVPHPCVIAGGRRRQHCRQNSSDTAGDQQRQPTVETPHSRPLPAANTAIPLSLE